MFDVLIVVDYVLVCMRVWGVVWFMFWMNFVDCLDFEDELCWCGVEYVDIVVVFVCLVDGVDIDFFVDVMVEVVCMFE